MAAETRSLVPGSAHGNAIVLDEPLSFWGGVEPSTGMIIDPHHPQFGSELSGRILVMETGRGSSSSSSVLCEAVRSGVAPVGIVLRVADPIVALGAVVARELYGAELPVVVADEELYSKIRQGDEIAIEAGRITIG